MTGTMSEPGLKVGEEGVPTRLFRPNGDDPDPSAFFKVLLVLGVWSVLPILAASQIYLDSSLQPQPSFTTVLQRQLWIWLPWVALTPVIFTMGRRFPLDGDNKSKYLWAHFLAAAVVSLGFLAYLNLALGPPPGMGPDATFLDGWLRRAASMFHVHFFMYWPILGVGYAFDYYDRFKAQQLRATRLAGQLAEAHLEALKMQLHPHFLFNTLHAVASLMEHDVAGARSMIARLSELLRAALEGGSTQEVRLEAELAFLENYLAIERIRFRDKLQAVTAVEAGTRDALVPAMILQPLVENAIAHGVEKRTETGHIEIAARKVGQDLVLTVSDDGPGFSHPNNEGIGLANIRERLAHLYGPEYRLEILHGGSGGVSARIRIPFHKEPMALPPEAQR